MLIIFRYTFRTIAVHQKKSEFISNMILLGSFEDISKLSSDESSLMMASPGTLAPAS